MARYHLKARPRFAVTQSGDGLRLSWWCIALNLWLAGAAPVRVHAARPRLDEEVDGVILGGGKDISPRLYDQTPLPGYGYDAARDALELAWLKRAEREDLPVFGICRGAQLMNIFRGGNLYQDIRKMAEKANYPNGTVARIFYRKSMQAVPGSLLHRIIGTVHCRVNSLHTQAIDHVGRGLTVAGVEDNGMVQAIEAEDRPFWLGVQFHPEYLSYDIRFFRLFEALVQEAALHQVDQGPQQLALEL